MLAVKNERSSGEQSRYSHCLYLVLAGCLMVVASFLPWLNDPTGAGYSAWAIPIDIGWQESNSILSYGLLCLACAGATFLIAYAYWRRIVPRKSGDFLAGLGWGTRITTMPTEIYQEASYAEAVSLRKEQAQRLEAIPLARWHLLTGLLCLCPLLLLLLQYTYVDIHAINLLAQHKLQILLIQQHMGYKLAEMPIQLQPFQVDGTTLQGRLTLFVDQVSFGLLGPCLSAGILLGSLPSTKFLSVAFARRSKGRSRQQTWIVVGSGILVCMLLCMLLRTPLATLSEYQTRMQLAAGNYGAAHMWLDRAALLNPALTRTSSYHEELGQIWYFTHPGKPNNDSHLYLASVYRAQGDYLSAYQELLLDWQAMPGVPWIQDEMGLTVALMAENVPQKAKGLKGAPLQLSDLEVSSLTWLHILSQVDRANLYSLYYVGRIQYDKHDYDSCIGQMQAILRLSKNTDILSSAYTYIALSLQGEGNVNQARHMLLKAIELDPYYHNNTAREELSGLH